MCLWYGKKYRVERKKGKGKKRGKNERKEGESRLTLMVSDTDRLLALLLKY